MRYVLASHTDEYDILARSVRGTLFDGEKINNVLLRHEKYERQKIRDCNDDE